jgi:hypothetical protein
MVGSSKSLPSVVAVATLREVLPDFRTAAPVREIFEMICRLLLVLRGFG